MMQSKFTLVVSLLSLLAGSALAVPTSGQQQQQLLQSTILGGHQVESAGVPTVQEAAVQARKLLLQETIGTLSSIYPENHPDKDLRGVPVGLMEYFADCSTDGSPAMLGMHIATNFKNAGEDGYLSLSLRETPKGDKYIPIAKPRMAIMGKLYNVTLPEEQKRIEECYLKRHPVAKWWLPGKGFHGTYWVTLKVEKVYFVGGFGNVAYVGFIPADMFKAVPMSKLVDNEEENAEL